MSDTTDLQVTTQAGTPRTRVVPYTGANTGAPVFDVLAVIAVKVKWRGRTTTMTAKERALAERMVDQFPSLMRTVSSGKLGVRIWKVVKTDLMDLDVLPRAQQPAPSGYTVEDGADGYMVTEERSDVVFAGYNGATYDSRNLFMSRRAVDCGAYGLTNTGGHYSFVNVADDFYDGDYAAQSATDAFVHEFNHQVEGWAGLPTGTGDYDANPTGLHGGEENGFSHDPVTSFLSWQTYWYATYVDQAKLHDDGRAPSVVANLAQVPFRFVDPTRSWAEPGPPQTVTETTTDPVVVPPVITIPDAPPVAGMRSIGRMTAELHVVTRDNVFVRDISDQLVAGKVLMNQDVRVPMSFSATLRDVSALRPFRDYLAPALTITYDDGTVVSGQVGLYAVMPFSEQQHRREGSQGTVDGRDLTWALDAFTFARTYTVPASSNAITAVRAILAAAGVTRFEVPSAPTRLPRLLARSWPAGTSALDMVNELLGGIGYYALWADGTGRLVTMPFRDLRTVAPVASFASGPATEIMDPVISEKSNLAQFYNRVTVIKEVPGLGGGPGGAISATRTNTDPASPTSTVSLGTPDQPLVIARPTVRDSTLEDRDAVNALAERLLQESLSNYRVLTVKVLPNPTLGVHDVVALDVTNRRGDRIASGRWLCRTWELGFTPGAGAMTLEVNAVEEAA